MYTILERLKIVAVWKNISTIYNDYLWKSEFHLYVYNAGQDKSFARSVQQYWASLKWFSIPASVGFAYICYQQFWHIRRREQHRIQSSETPELVANSWQVSKAQTDLFENINFMGVMHRP